ncbi:flagellar motor switch protein FliN [Thiolapillus sp.]
MSEQAATTAAESESLPEAEVPPKMEAGAEDTPLPPDAEETASGVQASQEEYRNAEFDALENEEDMEGIEPNLDVILNIPVTLSMQIGTTQMTIEELMRLNRGSVVKLDRMAGEPMDVLVNGTLIAHGEVVVVNDKFGIRLLDVISPAERVKKLR